MLHPTYRAVLLCAITLGNGKQRWDRENQKPEAFLLPLYSSRAQPWFNPLSEAPSPQGAETCEVQLG